MQHWMNWLTIAYMGTMIVLFSKFFVKRYLYCRGAVVTSRTKDKKPKEMWLVCLRNRETTYR